MNIWTCLCRVISITAIEVGKPPHCGWHHSLDVTLDCVSGERVLSSQRHSLLFDS